MRRYSTLPADSSAIVAPNNGIQLTALRAAPDAGRSAHQRPEHEDERCSPHRRGLHPLVAGQGRVEWESVPWRRRNGRAELGEEAGRGASGASERGESIPALGSFSARGAVPAKEETVPDCAEAPPWRATLARRSTPRSSSGSSWCATSNARAGDGPRRIG